MVDRVSTAGRLLSDSSIIRQNQLLVQRLQNQLSTGKKYQELKLYGNDASRLVNLRSDVTAREAYIRSITLTEVITDTYDAVLERMAEVADEVLKAADSTVAQSATFEDDTTTISNNLFLEIEVNLNLDVGGRFVFGGTRLNQAPVKDIRTLTDYTAGDAADTIEADPTLPLITYAGGTLEQSYMELGAAVGTVVATADPTDAQSFQETSVTINDGRPITYGITAADSAFQNLVESVLRLRSSAQTGLTEDERATFLAEARVVANTAREEIRQLQTSNGVVMNELIRTRNLHQDFVNINFAAMEEIEGVDTTETALQLSAITTQIESSFAAISRRNQLSLVNFI